MTVWDVQIDPLNLYSTDDYLIHHGILGQKWGVRRYQNEDGTLTEAGKKRAARLEKKIAKTEKKTGIKYKRVESDDDDNTPKPKKKTINDMDDDELRNFVARLELENRYASAMNQRLPKEEAKKTSRWKEAVQKGAEKSISGMTTKMMNKGFDKLISKIEESGNRESEEDRLDREAANRRREEREERKRLNRQSKAEQRRRDREAAAEQRRLDRQQQREQDRLDELERRRRARGGHP